ncbi:MAG TPA: hypothetical protein DEF59_03875 [Candidatus Magasanikbacteria bacterium]|nr:hypothetical protein [Candidatus Magasanikbacteria bacterium]
MAYTYNPIYHHLKGKNVTRSELVERGMIDIILKSKMPDAERSWSKVFELKHTASVTQIGRMLAQKRGLDTELGTIICAMHDIYVFMTGRATNHAHLGAQMAERFLKKTKKFTPKEIKIITSAIFNHSDKNIISKDPYVELVKDADVLDCGLCDGVHDAYVYEKSPANCRVYFDRIKKVRKEFGLPKDPKWDSIEYVEQAKGYGKKLHY